MKPVDAFLIFILYALSSVISLWVAEVNPRPLSLLWLPSGVGIAILLLKGPRPWLIIWLAAFAVNTPYLYMNGLGSLPTAFFVGVGVACCSALEALLGYYLFTRLVGLRAFERSRGMFAFALLIGLVPSLIAMFGLSALYLYTNYLPDNSTFTEVWLAYTLANTHSTIIIAPIAIGILMQRPAPNRREAKSWLGPGLLLVAVLLATLRAPPTVYLLLPLLVWIALGHSLFGTAIANASCAIILSIFTAYDIGPFVNPDPWQEFLDMLLFNLSTGFTVIFLATQQRNLAVAQQGLERQVQERTAQLQAANLRLAELAGTDELTGAMNRRSFFTQATAELQTSQRHRRPLCAMIVDLDHFKEINDRFGHNAGDITLRTFYRCCREELRQGDLVGRIGGEEFAILLPETDFFHGVQVAEKLRAAVQALHIRRDDQVIKLTVSIGVAEVCNELDAALRLADERLYAAKNNGRNQVGIG